jgi:hypothetical protein
LAFETFQAESSNRRSVYTVWLRLLVLIGIIAGTVVLVFPSILASYTEGNLPWNEERRILKSGQSLRRAPSRDQPQITDVLNYKAQTWQEDVSGGRVNFIIYPDGIVKGVWNGEYDNDGARRTILAACFCGNIDPTKPCIENGIHDASKLYFITAGTFTLLQTQAVTGLSRGINGFIYVRGWIDPNYNATGEIFVTENKKSFDVFTWSAAPAD